jgi:hypothetical protein
MGKLTVASRWQKPIPAGWAWMIAGCRRRVPSPRKHRLLTPLGGTRDLGSHKG